jgi:NAD(P)-dependent dehydrogenase (short-subunit alcohol dehydrogenase family)
MNDKHTLQPPQHQDQQPGLEEAMLPVPQAEDPNYLGSNKLKDKVAIITGGDSGIGRAVAIAFAKEGSDIALMYLNEHEDAKQTAERIQQIGQRCLLLAGDIGIEDFCQKCVQKIISEFKQINILVNNAAEQHPKESLLEISQAQLERTFQTNIFSLFYLTKAVLPHLHEGDTIINTTSVTAYRGSKHLLDYSTTKGAIVSFTRSLAASLVEKNIRVNGVAPGPVWTPLIPASFSEEKVAEFGGQVPMQRAAQPAEIAPCYVFLASRDSSYMTGQILHPNGGEIVGG